MNVPAQTLQKHAKDEKVEWETSHDPKSKLTTVTGTFRGHKFEACSFEFRRKSDAVIYKKTTNRQLLKTRLTATQKVKLSKQVVAHKLLKELFGVWTPNPEAPHSSALLARRRGYQATAADHTPTRMPAPTAAAGPTNAKQAR